ncbi:non-specific lipid-transfer protein [Artemisia annua]|uniref:Non-specific lipid-transfer protein n=1 Tax=Artemisia annua TaxID=35608 RepID=A0A2U1Q9P4_ARTAN|nr:non-specific lipid-transfer protein [Artemisia annua]
MVGMIMKVLCILVVSMPYTEAATSCGISKCVYHLNASIGGGAVPRSCCNALEDLNATLRTTHDRQQSCACISKMYKSLGNFKHENAVNLPRKCRVNITFIVPETDCAKSGSKNHASKMLTFRTSAIVM